MSKIQGGGGEVPQEQYVNTLGSKDKLKETSGQSNVVDGVLVNSAKGQDIKSLTSAEKSAFEKDMMEKASKGELSFTKLPGKVGSPGAPLINDAGEVNHEAVKQFVDANPWFSSSFLVALTMNIAALVENHKKAQELEATIFVLQMQQTIELAKTLGELIMAKAELEQAQYMGMAIASIVTLAVAVAGAAVSIKGALSSAKATKLNDKLDDLKMGKQDGDGPVEGSQTTKVGVDAKQVASSKKPDTPDTDLQSTQTSGNKVDDIKTTKDKDAKVEDSQKQQLKSEESSNERARSESRSEEEDLMANTSGEAGGGEGRLAGGVESREPYKPLGDIEPNLGQADGKGAVSAPVDGKTSTQATAVESKQSTDSAAAKDAQNVPAGDTSTRDDLRAQRNAASKDAAYYTNVGHLLVHSNTSLNQAATNFIQMVYVMPIADKERLIEYLRNATLRFSQNAYENAQKSFGESTQGVDSALRLMQQIASDVARAFSPKG